MYKIKINIETKCLSYITNIIIHFTTTMILFDKLIQKIKNTLLLN